MVVKAVLLLMLLIALSVEQAFFCKIIINAPRVIIHALTVQVKHFAILQYSDTTYKI